MPERYHSSTVVFSFKLHVHAESDNDAIDVTVDTYDLKPGCGLTDFIEFYVVDYLTPDMANDIFQALLTDPGKAGLSEETASHLLDHGKFKWRLSSDGGQIRPVIELSFTDEYRMFANEVQSLANASHVWSLCELSPGCELWNDDRCAVGHSFEPFYAVEELGLVDRYEIWDELNDYSDERCDEDELWEYIRSELRIPVKVTVSEVVARD